MVKSFLRFVGLVFILLVFLVTVAFAETQYSESFSARNENYSAGWTFTKTGADYADVLTNHLKMEKNTTDNGYVEVSKETATPGLAFAFQINLEFDFYVTGVGQNTRILLPISINNSFILGIYICDQGIYTTSYNGVTPNAKLCDVTQNKLYTLKIESIKNSLKTKLSITSGGESLYINDELPTAAYYGNFTKVIYRVEGANTSFNLKRFALDGRYDNYATKFDYFENDVIPSDYTVTTNNVGSAVIEEDPEFVKEGLGIALISNGSGSSVSAVKDLGGGAVEGSNLMFETTFKATVDITGAEIYLQSGDKSGLACDYLTYLKIVRAKSGEDTALTMQYCTNGTYKDIKTGITDLGKDHLLSLYMNLTKGSFDIYLDEVLIAESCKFYGGNIPSNKNVEFITYRVNSSSGNSFVIKKHALTATYGTSDDGIVLSKLGYYDALTGEEISKLKAGTINVKAAFSELTDVENLYLVLCYYEDNSLEKISISKDSLSSTEQSKELLCSIDCDNVGGNSVLKLYIWRDIDNARFLFRDSYELR